MARTLLSTYQCIKECCRSNVNKSNYVQKYQKIDSNETPTILQPNQGQEFERFRSIEDLIMGSIKSAYSIVQAMQGHDPPKDLL